MYELTIQNGNNVYFPSIEGEITLKSERKGTPATLTFNVLKDDVINFLEGNGVAFRIDGVGVFYGFVFQKKRDKDNIITVTCYDQLRYFKNKDTYVYTDKTASELIKMVSEDFQLKTGTIEDSVFKIASKVEDNVTLFDIVQNALDDTILNTNQMFVLYDDFSEITLKNIGSMIVPILIDEETAENFSYTSSIDSATYNKIKLYFNNEETGKRDIYIAQSGENINNWGILQHYEEIKEGENGQAKADALLSLYNKKTRNLSINNCFGDARVRAGSMIYIRLHLGDIATDNLMLVENCKHKFLNDEHFMDLTLRGGEFIA